MNGFDIREVMEQVHISSEMQEEIILNVQNHMRKKNRKTWDWKKTAAAAAAFLLIAGIFSPPVQAMVKNIFMERMESMPENEVHDIAEMVQGQEALADSFSREFTEGEKERYDTFWQSYKDGLFPEGAIIQVESGDEATEGTLYYIRPTGEFCLPGREMTDEEILEIIDFQQRMNYAITQTSVSQEEREAYLAEEERLREIIQNAGGISEEEAVEIAEKQIEADLGEAAKELELMTDSAGNGADLMDISGEEYDSKAGVAYDVGFGNPDTHFTHGYLIDAVDGSILETWEYSGSME